MPNTFPHLMALLVAAAMAVFSLLAPLASEAKVKGIAVDVAAHAVPLDHYDPKRHSVGRLRYLGGLSLASGDQRFGGLSALDVSADGNTLVALSDRGFWVRARPIYARGRLAGIQNVTIGSLAGSGGPDAESLARSQSGDMIIAFERTHRLLRYARLGSRPDPIPVPEETVALPFNGGIEALTSLSDGRLLMFSEELRAGDGIRGWVQAANGAWSALVLVTEFGFHPTGAATLPNGDVILLERRFPPLNALIRIIPAESIAAGANLHGEVIARLGNGITLDNMEGIAVRTDETGRTLVYLVSDDNFNIFQQTLLMMFELTD